MAIVEALMTAEEFGRMPDGGRRTELILGRIVEVPPTNFTHGRICIKMAFYLMTQFEERDLGRVVINDSGIVTRRGPDTVRGADVAYYSYDRLPKGVVPEQYPDIPPELVVEVRSPSDRWAKVHTKVAEYLNLGVLVVCVLDPGPESAHLFYPDRPARTLGPDDELTFEGVLGDFRVAVRRLFE